MKHLFALSIHKRRARIWKPNLQLTLDDFLVLNFSLTYKTSLVCIHINWVTNPRLQFRYVAVVIGKNLLRPRNSFHSHHLSRVWRSPINGEPPSAFPGFYPSAQIYTLCIVFRVFFWSESCSSKFTHRWLSPGSPLQRGSRRYCFKCAARCEKRSWCGFFLSAESSVLVLVAVVGLMSVMVAR